jgi:hypothetical protein
MMDTIETKRSQCGRGHMAGAAVEVASSGGFGVVVHAARVWTLHHVNQTKVSVDEVELWFNFTVREIVVSLG